MLAGVERVLQRVGQQHAQIRLRHRQELGQLRPDPQEMPLSSVRWAKEDRSRFTASFSQNRRTRRASISSQT